MPSSNGLKTTDKEGVYMDKDVLLIGNNKSFMYNAIANGLENEGFVTNRCVMTEADIVRAGVVHSFWILYLDETNVGKEYRDQYNFIKENILMNNPKFFIIGHDSELQDIYQFVPQDIISKTYPRPINVQQLVSNMNRMIADEEGGEAKKRILIVDGTPASLHTLQKNLLQKYDVYMCNSGMSAITFLVKETVDLILLDVEMPIVDGMQVLEMLRSEPTIKDIPIMFLTSKSDKEHVMKAAKLNVESYLLKSMSPKLLVRSIDNYFESPAYKKKHKQDD